MVHFESQLSALSLLCLRQVHVESWASALPCSSRVLQPSDFFLMLAHRIRSRVSATSEQRNVDSFTASSRSYMFQPPMRCPSGFLGCSQTQLYFSYGTYLALTGRRVTGEEAINLGIATHFVHSSRIPVSCNPPQEELSVYTLEIVARLFTTDSASCSFHRQQQLILC